MSVSASIDVSFIKNDISNFSATDLIETMLHNNWTIKKDNKICYLPVGDELFEWEENEISETKLMEIVYQKELKHETIGVILFWENTDVGVSMLIFQDYQISFNITVNRIKMNDLNCDDITDVNWYLTKIITCFFNYKISEISFNQTC